MLRSVLPRFEVALACPQVVVAGKIASALRAPDAGTTGWVELPYAELHVPIATRHFWSPRLQVTFDDRGDTTQLHCTFRPEPGVWTGFVFAHCVCWVLALCGLSMGLSQWTLGRPPTALIALGLGMLLSLGLYVGALLGHRLGMDQMRALRRFFDRAIGSDDPATSRSDPTIDAVLEGLCEEQDR